MLAANISVSNAIERCAVAGLGHDRTILDLLVRLHLAPDNRLRAVDLCHQLMLSPSHISRMLDRAEADNLVKRAPHPNDRRANYVHLTEPGSKVIARLAPRMHSVLDAVIHQTLTPDEIDSLVDMLGRIDVAGRAYAANC